MLIDKLEIKETDSYINQHIKDSLLYFEVDSEKGLSSHEAQKRLEHFGGNEIDEKEESLLHRIFRRFWGPIPWMIEIAALLSAFVQRWVIPPKNV